MQENLFKDFEKVSAAEWKTKVIIDLKGKSFEDLNWMLKDGFKIAPYYTEEDTKSIDFPILRNNNPDWQVGEKIEVKDIKTANQVALDVLMKGATAITFHFYTMPNQVAFNLLFENIGIEHIATHFSFETDNIAYDTFFSLWQNLLAHRNLQNIKAYFDFDPLLLKDDNQLENLAKLLLENKNNSAKIIHINCRRFQTNEANIDIELSNCISKAKQYFDYFIDKGISPETIAKHTFFTVRIGLSYLLEIAKLRALKILWTNLLATYNVKASLPFIKVEFLKEAYFPKDEFRENDDNLINATSMSMSAVLGGANHLIVTPINESEKAKRLARNIQLVLKHESGFHQVSDPMAGSYYVEVLTDMYVKSTKS